MDYKKLAELLFPNVHETIEDLEKKYPERKLENGSEVMRFAPSPTGRMHMGNLFASFFPEVFSHQSNGIFVLRIEDTDDKRAIENGVQLILDDLKEYNYIVDENPIDGGKYEPYIQTQRKEIYAICAKYLVSIGKAYPCFCTEDDLNDMRKKQEGRKDRIGYYGDYARCRNLSFEEIKEKINKNEQYVIRLKSFGDFEKKFIFNDLIKGKILLPENDIDHVLLKSDGIPPYAFAHVVDDHFMRITTVTRDDSYISSVAFHLEIWNDFGFKTPNFAHLLPINKKEENGNIRKISKRKDPEAAVSFYTKRGVPTEAIKLYFATLLNSNFEMWYLQNQDKNYRDFKFDYKKMSTSGGPIFDLEKLLNISKTYISKMKAETLYDEVLKYSKEYDIDFYNIINSNKEYTINMLNIEREIDRPRKDISCYSDVKKEFSYMFNELFNSYNSEIKDFYKIETLKDYFNNIYNEKDDKQTWFDKIKDFAPKYNFATDNKLYKEDPSKYAGNVSSLCELIRVAVTDRTNTPDLYEILKLLGTKKIEKRIEMFEKYLKQE